MEEVKLQGIILNLHKMAGAAIGAKNLSDYASQKGITMEAAEQWKFALRAQDIIEQRLHPNLVGCTGVARVFSYLAKKQNIEHKVILTAVSDELYGAHNSVAHGGQPNLINGHQVIAANIDGDLRMFDPAKRTLKAIDGDVFIGRRFKFDFSDREYVITNIMSNDEYEKIKSLSDLQDSYMKGAKQIYSPQYNVEHDR